MSNTPNELINEIQSNQLRVYNRECVNATENEICYIEEQLEALDNEAEEKGVNDELKINFVILSDYKDRNVRILKSYQFHRLLKIQEDVLCHSGIDCKLFSDEEIQFKSNFSNLIDEYFSGLDCLEISNREIPIEFYVKIKNF